MTTRFCRNTTQSNGWPYRDKPFLDKHSNGSNLRRDNYNRDQHRRYSERSYFEVNNQNKQSSGDHRIRITVNGGIENSAYNDQHPSSTDESESGASVTVVEIDDSLLSDDDFDTPNVIRNTLNHTPSKFTNCPIERYNEKPIDVPEDFERKAYELSPFVRVLEPHSQVIICISK